MTFENSLPLSGSVVEHVAHLGGGVERAGYGSQLKGMLDVGGRDTRGIFDATNFLLGIVFYFLWTLLN